MVPEGWDIKKVADILERVVDPVDVDPNTYYEQIGIRSHGKGIFYKEAVSGKQLGNKRVFWIKPNCFIVNIVFAWEQAIAKTTDYEVGKIASHRFPMYQPKPGQADIDYLVHFFKTPRGKYLLELASPGGAGRNKTLGQKEFANLKFPMPTGLEQKKIASILSTWDKAIETVEKLNESSKTQKKAIMQQLLTGKRRLPGFDGEWKDYHLMDVTNILVSPVDKKTIEGEKPVLLCNYTDVYYNTRIRKSLNFMQATATDREINKFTLTVGDVLITKDSETPGDIAVPAYVSEDLGGVVCGYHLAILRPKKGIVDGEFLSYLLSLEKTRYYFFTLATGATRFGLSVGSIEKALLNLPPLKEQQEIASVLTTADKEIETLQQKLDYLKQEKKALMQQILTGKRRVIIN